MPQGHSNTTYSEIRIFFQMQTYVTCSFSSLFNTENRTTFSVLYFDPPNTANEQYPEEHSISKANEDFLVLYCKYVTVLHDDS